MNQYIETPNNTKKDLSGYSKLMKSAVLGAIAGVFASVALMVVFALVINNFFGDPDGVLNIFTGIAAGTGAAAGGFFASRANGSKGFVTGITTGLLISVVILIIMIFNGKNPSDIDMEIKKTSDITFRLVIIICQIVFACAGGIFAANSRRSKKSGRSYPIGKINKK
jgi:putative membrane protein (TIGR04086 family)